LECGGLTPLLFLCQGVVATGSSGIIGSIDPVATAPGTDTTLFSKSCVKPQQSKI